MSRGLAAVRDFFVVPPARAAAPAVRAAPPARSFAVLGERRDAVAVAGALVLAAGGGCGLVCVWPSCDLGPRVPATAGARRLAARLAARGLTAMTSGRLVRVGLPAAPSEAVAAAQRAATVSPVTAVALTGARDDDLDTLLELQDAIVLVLREGPDSPLARLAVGGLAHVGIPVSNVGAPTGPARGLATAGLLAPFSLRPELAPALTAR